MGNFPAFESYLTIRAGLVQLTRFVRALEQHAGYQTIVVEDLNLRGLARSRLAKSMTQRVPRRRVGRVSDDPELQG